MWAVVLDVEGKVLSVDDDWLDVGGHPQAAAAEVSRRLYQEHGLDATTTPPQAVAITSITTHKTPTTTASAEIVGTTCTATSTTTTITTAHRINHCISDNVVVLNCWDFKQIHQHAGVERAGGGIHVWN